MIKNIFKHLRRVLIHKYWVAYYCFKCGLYWQGIMHDMSKFSPVEFWESVKYYQGTSSPINACKADKGYSLAWQHHKGRNPHHYEYWTDNYDKGTTCIEMPKKYVLELVCDYLGAARAYMGSAFSYQAEYDWWERKINICPPKMHYKTLDLITGILWHFDNCEKNGKDPFKTLNI